jgi:hypothetical protein
MKTSDFVLYGQKPKLTIIVGTENIFYLRLNILWENVEFMGFVVCWRWEEFSYGGGGKIYRKWRIGEWVSHL